MNLIYKFPQRLFLIYFLLLFCGCATLKQQPKSSIIARVNDAFITTEDLMKELQAFHLQKMQLGKDKAQTLNFKEFLDGMIDKELFIQEARRAGLDKSDDFRQAMAEIKRAECLRLWWNEKISKLSKGVTKEDVSEYFKKLGQEPVELASLDLRQRRKIIMEKEEGLRQARLKRLKEKVRIEIFDDMVKGWLNDKNPQLVLAKVNKDKITGQELEKEIKGQLNDLQANDLKADDIKNIDQLLSVARSGLNILIDDQLIEQDAFKQGYLDRKEVKEKLLDYEENLLYRDFLQNVLAKKIQIREEDLASYYAANPDFFREETMIWVDQMEINNQDMADQIHQELEQGVDFAFWEKTKGGEEDIQYSSQVIPLQRVVPELKSILSPLTEGEISPPFKSENRYFIFKIKRKQEGKLLPLDKVKGKIRKRLISQRFKLLVQDSVQKLRQASEIIIYDDNWQGLVSKYKTVDK